MNKTNRYLQYIIKLSFMCFIISAYACNTNINLTHENQDDLSDDNLLTGYSQDIDVNRVFFSPCGILTNVAKAGVKGDENNQGKYFDYTRYWQSETDTLVWLVDVEQSGILRISPFLGVPEQSDKSLICLELADEKQDLMLSGKGSYLDFEQQDTVSFKIPSKGRYSIKMYIKENKNSAEMAYVKSLKLMGPAAQNLTPVELRWRPAAVHAKWNTEKAVGKVIMSVHEVNIISSQYDSYQPITTPFGYYGSTWNAKTQKFGGVNFSLWSFSASAPPPPAEQFSHLIAVGEGLYIDGFNHEGTGSKARGDNPYEKLTGTMQRLAIKKVPGNPYDTYYTFYYDTNQNKWKLYGCGKKYNTKALTYLSVGAFVEQPGAAEKQRSNHQERVVAFKSWFMDEAGNWVCCDKMTPNGKIEPYSYKNWSYNADSQFCMHMGGSKTIIEAIPDPLIISSGNDLPDFLSAEKLKELEKLPADIALEDSENVTLTSALVKFRVADYGTNPRITLYWGEKDGLTFVKENKGGANVVFWENAVELHSDTQNPVLGYELKNLTPATRYYYRLQIKNDEGETWSFDTQMFHTKL